MFFSYAFVKCAYNGLKNLDTSEGKSRKEKVSCLRYLIAAREIHHKDNYEDISLAVGSEHRQEFISAVGEVVALNDQGL